MVSRSINGQHVFLVIAFCISANSLLATHHRRGCVLANIVCMSWGLLGTSSFTTQFVEGRERKSLKYMGLDYIARNNLISTKQSDKSRLTERKLLQISLFQTLQRAACTVQNSVAFSSSSTWIWVELTVYCNTTQTAS